MSIESSLKWLSKRLTNQYDINSLNEIITWVNDQSQTNVNENLLFAKLFIHKLTDIKQHDLDSEVNAFNQRAMIDILRLDLDVYYSEFTEVLNMNYTKQIFEQNGIECELPSLKSDKTILEDKLKLNKMSEIDIEKIKKGLWDAEDVKDRLNTMISNSLNKFQ